jgi:hypothetical protein
MEEHSFNIILVLQRAEMCQRHKKRCFYGVQIDLRICRNGRDVITSSENDSEFNS